MAKTRRPGGESPGGSPRPGTLSAALRLIVVTDARIASPRSVTDVVSACLAAGARAVQLRDKEADARELAAQARTLAPLVRNAGGLFFVNDRLDVALAVEADGVHLGADDLPVRLAKSAAPEGFLIGYSTDRPGSARSAQEDGADYIGCGTVYPTDHKADAGEAIGVEGLARVAEAVDVPVVGIGGVTPRRADEVAGTPATGVAVMGALMEAHDPGEATRRILAAFEKRGG